MIAALLILVFSFVQSIAGTMNSRARNRDNINHHIATSVLSNGAFFATLHQLVTADLTWWLIVPYVTGTVCGALTGVKVAMKIEKAIGSRADPKEE